MVVVVVQEEEQELPAAGKGGQYPTPDQRGGWVSAAPCSLPLSLGKATSAWHSVILADKTACFPPRKLTFQLDLGWSMTNGHHGDPSPELGGCYQLSSKAGL